MDSQAIAASTVSNGVAKWPHLTDKTPNFYSNCAYKRFSRSKLHASLH